MTDNCINCNIPLVSIFPTHPNKQYDNALEVKFDGGYGMFIDPCHEYDHENETNYLCHDCAHELCEQVPWIKKLLQPHRAHSHSDAYKLANPSHYGYDYTY